MSVPPRSHDSFCVLLHDSGPNGLTKPDFHTANSHQINPTVYTRRQNRCTQQNGSKTPCKTLHAQSAILLHPKLRSLTEKKQICISQNRRLHGKFRTDSSSFSMPVGICGTARLMDTYSCRSGRSSQRKTGSGLRASSARALNDSLLILLYKSIRSPHNHP